MPVILIVTIATKGGCDSANELPKTFMEEIPNYAKVAQMVYPFGGEPILFWPSIRIFGVHIILI